MNNPVSQVLALGRVPAAVAGDIRAIADAALRVPVIERTLISLLAELRLVGEEISRVTTLIDPQQKNVSRIDQRVQTINHRTAVIERTLLDLKEKIETTTQLLPDGASHHDDRAPLLTPQDANTAA